MHQRLADVKIGTLSHGVVGSCRTLKMGHRSGILTFGILSKAEYVQRGRKRLLSLGKIFFKIRNSLGLTVKLIQRLSSHAVGLRGKIAGHTRTLQKVACGGKRLVVPPRAVINLSQVILRHIARSDTRIRLGEIAFGFGIITFGIRNVASVETRGRTIFPAGSYGCKTRSGTVQFAHLHHAVCRAIVKVVAEVEVQRCAVHFTIRFQRFRIASGEKAIAHTHHSLATTQRIGILRKKTSEMRNRR